MPAKDSIEKKDATKLRKYIKDINKQIDKERKLNVLFEGKNGILWTIVSYKVTDGERIPWHPYKSYNTITEECRNRAVASAARTAKEGRFIDPGHHWENSRGDHCEVEIHATWFQVIIKNDRPSRKYTRKKSILIKLDTRDDLFTRYWNEHSKSKRQYTTLKHMWKSE